MARVRIVVHDMVVFVLDTFYFVVVINNCIYKTVVLIRIFLITILVQVCTLRNV